MLAMHAHRRARPLQDAGENYSLTTDNPFIGFNKAVVNSGNASVYGVDGDISGFMNKVTFVLE